MPRERLLERFARTGTRVTCVVAGAGYGKTLLCRDWILRSARHQAFVQADHSLNQPKAFWSELVQCVASAGGSTGSAFQRQLNSELGDVDHRMIASYAQELNAAPLPQSGLALVIDGYHLLSEPRVHSAMSLLIELLPRRMDVVILTREHPPLPLARWRRAGWLCEIGQRDLRFTRDEVRKVLRSASGRQLSDEIADRIGSRSAGWPALVHLAGLALGNDIPEKILLEALDIVSGSSPKPSHRPEARKLRSVQPASQPTALRVGATGLRSVVLEGAGDERAALSAVQAKWRLRGCQTSETLSVREQEVLHLLPTELSNRELASELYISLNTVKTHLKALYRKLGATNRSDAVSRARAASLLPPRRAG